MIFALVGATACAPTPQLARVPESLESRGAPRIAPLQSTFAPLGPQTSMVREYATARRNAHIAGGVTVVAALTCAGFTIASAVNDSSIKDGGFATGGDIGDAASRGQTFNEVAYVTGAATAIAAGVTIALYAYARSPKETSSSVAKPASITSKVVSSLIGGVAF